MARARNYNANELKKRTFNLTLAFTGLAVLYGCLLAPAFIPTVGAMVGLLIGLPLSAVLAVLLRWKPPVIAYAAVVGCVLLMLFLVSVNEIFYNPLLQIGMLLLTGIGVGWLAPDDKSLLDPALCPTCGYPIGTSPVCTECGKQLG